MLLMPDWHHILHTYIAPHGPAAYISGGDGIMNECLKSIFEYTDYRCYLRDYVAHRRRSNAAFSYRSIAHRMQCDAGWFNRIVTGKRNISAEHVLKLTAILAMNKKERNYFELLVQFNQAKKQAEKDHYFEQMHQFRLTRVKEVSVQQYAMYSHWYYVVIREFLHVVKERCTPVTAEMLRDHIEPRVKLGEVQDALLALEKLGIVQHNEEGGYELRDRFITTGAAAPQVIVNRILIEFMELAKAAIDRVPRGQRSMSSVTFSASAATCAKIQSRVDEIRREILAMVEADPEQPSRVFHLNLHLFPVSKPYKER